MTQPSAEIDYTPFAFEPWPKIARLNRDITVTEKIDGTNAAVLISEDGRVAAQSRKRLITPGDDNFGFARWVAENCADLVEALGPGRHFGEWWGSGIQRGYGLIKGEKRFSLFNTARYGDLLTAPHGLDLRRIGLYVVPVIYQGPFSEAEICRALDHLKVYGSRASEDFMDPEGIIIFHSAAQQMFKVTIKGDEAPKSLCCACGHAPSDHHKSRGECLERDRFTACGCTRVRVGGEGRG